MLLRQHAKFLLVYAAGVESPFDKQRLRSPLTDIINVDGIDWGLSGSCMFEILWCAIPHGR